MMGWGPIFKYSNLVVIQYQDYVFNDLYIYYKKMTCHDLSIVYVNLTQDHMLAK